MKIKTLVSVIALAAGAGCSTLPGPDSAWDVKPFVSVRHGMLSARAYYQLGRYQERQGRLEAAEASYRKALDADTHYVEALNALGALYARRGDLERSVTVLQQVLREAPDTAYLHNNMGYALLLQGQHAAALEELRTAVRLDPAYARAWVNLAAAARAAGQPELAQMAERRRLPNDAGMVAGNEAPPAVAPSESGAMLALSTRLSVPAGESAQAPVLIAQANPVPVPAAEVAGAAPASKTVTAAPASGRALTVSDMPVRTVTYSVGADAATPAQSVPGVMTVALDPDASRAHVMHADLTDASVFSGVRVEVSNGNGVSRFATRFSRRMATAGVEVSRITNYDRFDLTESVIEYHAGFEAAARALRDRLGGRAQLVETTEMRWGSDVRVILGGDAVSAPPLRT